MNCSADSEPYLTISIVGNGLVKRSAGGTWHREKVHRVPKDWSDGDGTEYNRRRYTRTQLCHPLKNEQQPSSSDLAKSKNVIRHWRHW